MNMSGGNSKEIFELVINKLVFSESVSQRWSKKILTRYLLIRRTFYIYIYAFSRHFYSKRIQAIHFMYVLFYLLCIAFRKKCIFTDYNEIVFVLDINYLVL